MSRWDQHRLIWVWRGRKGIAFLWQGRNALNEREFVGEVIWNGGREEVVEKGLVHWFTTRRRMQRQLKQLVG